MYKGRHNTGTGLRALLWVLVALLTGACANMGRPEGGPRDETPPVFLRSDPAPGATNVSKTQLSAYFDENIQLEDAFSKVIVSPAQKQPPAVSANGRRLTVQFRDTLRPNTTYTIDFADAIKDLNEGNILDGFALDFSTGDSIDSLRISGMVLQAENLEPAQGMLVGVYSAYTDTSLTTLPFDRIARTSQTGHFTIRNLKPGAYRIFAVNDLNRDYHWDRSEDIAFYDSLIVPWVEHIEVTDTLFASDGEDSLSVRQGLRFMPNDILLTWFNVGYKPSYLSDYKRLDRRRFTLTFGAPQDTLPVVTIVDGTPGIGRAAAEWSLLRSNATQDTLEYWISDPEVLAADSLRLSVNYLKSDSADRLVWSADTLRFFFRDPDRKKKDKKKKDEGEVPAFTVDSITGDTTFLPPADMEYLGVKFLTGSSQDLHRPLLFETDVPLEAIDSTGVHLEIKVDTLWKAVKFAMKPDSANLLMRRRIEAQWTGGEKYRLSIDSLAMTSIYGTWNKPASHEFTVKQPEDYSSIKFTLPGLDSLTCIVQLLNTSDAPVYQAVKPAGASTVLIPFVNPGTYYARLTIDTNGDGKWTTGNPVPGAELQPEEVYYFAKKLDLKKNWDVEQTWIVDELAVDMQKPYAIKKNKPKLKRGEQAPTDPDEDSDEYDSEYNPFDRTGRNERRSNNRNGGSNGMRRNTL